MAFITLKHKRLGFTLIELLVVIAIIAILAAILFPVFAQAKAAAKKTVDISHMKQMGTASQMYLSDSDGRFFMSNSGGNPQGWGFGPPDMVPGQVLQPYVKSTQVFVGANDPLSEAGRLADQIQYMGVSSVSKLTPEQRMYALMVRANVGYNYAFFSPWLNWDDSHKNGAYSGTVSESEVHSPSATLLFAQSIWDRDPSTGVIRGGGNWIIETPCWTDTSGALLRPLNKYEPGRLASYPAGWTPPASNRIPGSSGWLIYGGTWPFHNQTDLSTIQNGLKDGQIVIQMADTSTKAINIKKLADGCSQYGAGLRKGTMTDTDKFIWDLD